jgi:GNAT superfamily N-acetyltransferase
MIDEVSRAAPHPVTVRAAVGADLPACYRIWLRTQAVDAAAQPDPYPLHAHELATGRLLVAVDRAGDVVGFAGAIVRGDLEFLADAFVDPDHHGGGIGRRLLASLLLGPAGRRCTLASTYPRAVPLYASFGMLPRWPCYALVVEGAVAAGLVVPAGDGAIDVGPISTADGVRVDSALTGRDRAVDYAYWSVTYGAQVLAVSAGGAQLGIGVVRRRSPYAVAHADAAVIGPILACDGADPPRVVVALVRHVGRSGARAVRIPVPGPHPALAPLLGAGARIHDTDVFCASTDDVLDPTRHTPSVDLL